MLEISNELAENEQSPVAPRLDFDAEFAKARFEVRVPRSKLETLSRTGPTPTWLQEVRRHVRVRTLCKAILCYQQTYPTIERTEEMRGVLVTDISRSGIGMLCDEQLFPCEKMKLWIKGKTPLPIAIVRCRKIISQCFDTGAIFE